MALPATQDTYGGAFYDAITVDNPESTESAAFHNKLTSDVAEMTRTTDRAWVVFNTRGTNGAATVVRGGSHMGVGSGSLPTVARTSAGNYTVTYPTSYTKNIGPASAPVNVTENILFQDACGDVVSVSVMGRVQCTVSGNVITVLVISNVAGSDTASDLSGGQSIRIEAR